MTSHIQVGVGGGGGGGTGCTPLNRIYNQNYEKHRIPITTTGGGGGVVVGDGTPGMDRIANGQLSTSNSSSSLDYLYQAISLIEQKIVLIQIILIIITIMEAIRLCHFIAT